jgi:glucose-6-phosphate 1-dehydrogenase
MLQLLANICMEPPVNFTADEVRDEKVKVLHAVKVPQLETVPDMSVRARYTAGTVGGEEAPGYLDEVDVPDDSQTETYVALRLEVDNWRWAGVPIYLRTGKRLARKVTEIAVTLKPVPHLGFAQDGSLGVRPNTIRPVNMEFQYGTTFLSESPEAYERLIMDAMRGDATLFTRDDEVEAQWRICDPILRAWSERGEPPVAAYEAGSDGPDEADRIRWPGHDGWRAV